MKRNSQWQHTELTFKVHFNTNFLFAAIEEYHGTEAYNEMIDSGKLKDDDFMDDLFVEVISEGFNRENKAVWDGEQWQQEDKAVWDGYLRERIIKAITDNDITPSQIIGVKVN